MYLLFSILVGLFISFILFMLGPYVGGVIALGIVLGCLFRGLYLLESMYEAMSMSTLQKDKVQKAYEDYVQTNHTNEE